MNNIPTDYKVDVTKWDLFFHGGPLAFGNTHSRTRNIASIAINIVSKFALGFATFGIFTIFRVIAADKYGNKQDVYIHDEIDKITSMVDVKRLKEASENAETKHLNEESGIDYYSIYLRAVMTQKGLISETLDLEECFETLSEVEFPDQWRAALRAVDLYLGKLTYAEGKDRSELLQKSIKSLNTAKKQLSSKLERSNEENKALETIIKKFEKIAHLEETYRQETFNILQTTDSYLDQLIGLDEKPELTEAEETQRSELLQKYENSLCTAKNRLEIKLERNNLENKALGLIVEKLNQIDFAETLI